MHARTPTGPSAYDDKHSTIYHYIYIYIYMKVLMRFSSLQIRSSKFITGSREQVPLIVRSLLFHPHRMMVSLKEVVRRERGREEVPLHSNDPARGGGGVGVGVGHPAEFADK